jgi:hypothetical protein
MRNNDYDDALSGQRLGGNKPDYPQKLLCEIVLRLLRMKNFGILVEDNLPRLPVRRTM